MRLLSTGDLVYHNVNTGSLTGNLAADTQYRFNFYAYIQEHPHGDDGATATGCVTLAIGGATGGGQCGISSSVPAPAPLALLGLGLALVGVARRR